MCEEEKEGAIRQFLHPPRCGAKNIARSKDLWPGPDDYPPRCGAKNIARSKDLWPGPDDYPPRCGAKNIVRPLGLYQT
uniref:Uncharacterized protein n=1 Tax=Cucumis sativus TaxID=3659 RepID=A0A0A0KR96_CUCSA